MVSRIWIPTLAAGALSLRLAAAATAVAAPPEADLHPPAERLPIRVYTIDDGLAGDEIHAVLQDSRGFLWIATESGLSRFDGTRFVEYDPRQGLPSPNVTALAEAAGGALLAGTTGGLARLDPGRAAAGPVFAPVPDASGRLRHRVTALLGRCIPQARRRNTVTPDREAASERRRVAVRSSARGSLRISMMTAANAGHRAPS